MNASDPDGDALTFHLTQGPSHGSLKLENSGSFSYTPTGDFNGSDSSAYGD